MKVREIRDQLATALMRGKFFADKSGAKTIDLFGATFDADEASLFGEINAGYVKRELEWYLSESRNVNDIPGGPPAIWKQVATPDGRINSNYGWCAFSEQNGNQYYEVRRELRKNPQSRRGVMIYQRPSMWRDYNADGMSDFVCTNAVQYMVRDGSLHTIVQMRSNDAVFGYRNDFAWQDWVRTQLAVDLNVPLGPLLWSAGSLHVYDRHFYLVEHYAETGEPTITKAAFAEKYPVSPWKDAA